MEEPGNTPEDNSKDTGKDDRIEGKLLFKSRFVTVFAEINHQSARAACERLIALWKELTPYIPGQRDQAFDGMSGRLDHNAVSGGHG